MTQAMATLIGDVVGSKLATDRAGLQRSLGAVLESINERLAPAQPLELTVGDEFQGAFWDVATAVRTSLLVRVALLDNAGVDSRYGLGYGDVTVFDGTGSRVVQDGPGWWAARTAIDRAKRTAASRGTGFARTCFERWADEPGARGLEAAALDGFLLCRDASVDRMSPRGRRLLAGVLLGRTQAELAEVEGITQSAVSQSLASSGAGAIEAAQRGLEEADA